LAVVTVVALSSVNRRRARLVLIWVTLSRFNSWCGTFISRLLT